MNYTDICTLCNVCNRLFTMSLIGTCIHPRTFNYVINVFNRMLILCLIGTCIHPRTFNYVINVFNRMLILCLIGTCIHPRTLCKTLKRLCTGAPPKNMPFHISLPCSSYSVPALCISGVCDSYVSVLVCGSS